jgi:hypothetical protein
MAVVWGYFASLIGKFEAKDLLTLSIATYGAILSTIVFVYSITRERRRIVIKHAPGFFGYPGSGGTGPTMACLEVVNKGHRPVVISAPAILTPKKRKLVFFKAHGFDKFPRKLEDGESETLYVPYDEIGRALKQDGYSGIVRLRPMCNDTTGKMHFGKTIKLDVDMDWSKYR